MEIRSSPNYIWNIKDVLGQGATGAVYKGRDKVDATTKIEPNFSVSEAFLSSLENRE